jgi:hypothetical protein
MDIRNPFAARLQAAAASVAGSPRRDGTDRIEIVQHPATHTVQEADSRTQRAVTVPSATERQLSYIERLFSERDYSGERRPKFAARLAFLCDDESAREDLTIAEASNLIEYLIELPYSAPSPAVRSVDSAEVPAGRYAYTGVEGHTVFVKVDRPTEGRWEGYTFVSLQRSDDFESIPREARPAVLAAIVSQGVKASAVRYGHELGVCAVCGRTLTNESSREAGIGPRCAASFG